MPRPKSCRQDGNLRRPKSEQKIGWRPGLLFVSRPLFQAFPLKVSSLGLPRPNTWQSRLINAAADDSVVADLRVELIGALGVTAFFTMETASSLVAPSAASAVPETSMIKVARRIPRGRTLMSRSFQSARRRARQDRTSGRPPRHKGAA